MGFDPDIFRKVYNDEEVEAPAPAKPPESMEGQLQLAAQLALRHSIEILDTPLDLDNNPLLRAKTASANHILTTQVRVEETKFKARQSEDTFNKLLEIIAEEEKRLGRT